MVRESTNPIRAHTLAIIALLLLVAPPATSAADTTEEDALAGATGRYHPAFILVDELPAAYFDDGHADHLLTPQSSVQFFLRHCRQKDYATASWTLHLADEMVDPGSEAAGELARKLYSVLKHKGMVDWTSLPDRSDGQPFLTLTNGNHPAASEPRRSLRLGIAQGSDFPHAVMLNRVKATERPGLWLFAAPTCREIEDMYEPLQPGWLSEQLPGWATRYKWQSVPLWQWCAIILFALIAFGCGWVVLRISRWVLQTRVRDYAWSTHSADYLQWPLITSVTLSIFYLLVRVLLPLTGPINNRLDIILLIAIVAAMTWTMTRLISLVVVLFSSRLEQQVEEEDDPSVRRTLTIVSVLRRVLVFVAVVLAIGVVLEHLNLFRTVGIALLASAGAAGALIALAGGPVIGNLIAGLQLAVTRPVNIGDCVVIEDRYGWIEEITYTYLSVRTWDERRLIVPLRHFISQPFENLSKHSQGLIRTVLLHVDFHTDIEAVRKEYRRLAEEHEEWRDGFEPKLITLATEDEHVTLCAYVAAADPSACWWLHCDIREGLLRYVRRLAAGSHLPRERVQLLDHPNEDEGRPATGENAGQEQGRQANPVDRDDRETTEDGEQ